MSLYRGAGGASDATDDSTVNAVAGYASSAASSASSAATSATAADASASAASTSASSAASSASGVATNATNAASSASLASTYAASASNSKDAAAASAVIASDKAGLASSSESNAAASAATATTKAGEASSSASSAATSASNAASSASSALAIYGNTAAMNAAVAAAAASASTSSTQAGLSAASAADASASSDLAYEHELNAAEWASFAQGSANSAQSYATSALSARDATLAAYDSFDDRYLGVKSADPTTDNDGNPLIAGSLYFNDQTNMMMLRAGGFWVAAYTSGGSPSFGNTVVNGTLNVTGTITGNLTGNVTGNVSGNAGTVTNGVYTTGDQTIAGVKTLSSNPVLSAGTANGVAYLNGSKVLTTGSALTFNGTNVSTTGSVASTNATTGFVTDATNGFALFSGDPSSYNISRSSTTVSLKSGGDVALSAGASSPIIFGNPSEQMRLTSTGLGIGTSTVGKKLTVNGDIATVGGAVYLANFAADYSLSKLYWDNTNNLTVIDHTYSLGGINFRTNGADRMRLDASGNLIQSAPTTPPSLATNGTMVFNLTSNTNLRVSVRGSDGVTRTANITLA